MRLTKFLRSSIVQAVLARRFDEENAKLEHDLAAFADAVHRSMFSDEEWDLLQKCPRAWFYSDDRVTFIHLGEWKQLKLSKSVPRVSRDANYPLTPTQSRDYTKLIRRRDLLESNIHSAKTTTESLLATCRTTEKLLKVWPEVAEFVPKDEKSVPMPLAIPIQQLNELLNLP